MRAQARRVGVEKGLGEAQRKGSCGTSSNKNPGFSFLAVS